jgi:hypothetical protein
MVTLVVNQWLITAEASVRFQGSSYRICGGQGDTRVSFSSNILISDTDYSTNALYFCNIRGWYNGLFEAAVPRTCISHHSPSPTQHNTTQHNTTQHKHTHTN